MLEIDGSSSAKKVNEGGQINWDRERSAQLLRLKGEWPNLSQIPLKTLCSLIILGFTSACVSLLLLPSFQFSEPWRPLSVLKNPPTHTH